jgi:hypothetical protein
MGGDWMSQRNRILIVVAVVALVGGALGLSGLLQRGAGTSGEPEAGKIHVYVDGRFVANVDPEQVSALATSSFVDSEKGKTQEGPRLRDVVLLYADEGDLQADSIVKVSGIQPSNDKAKEATVTWGQASESVNNVLLDVSVSSGALKLVSTLPGLDTRADWVQGIQRIEVTTRP